jgi:glycosyltransferase involved in cell wall biosynthesis
VPDSLLVIVPAYNEEAAVGGVVRAIHAAMPKTPVLVIDDCSTDATQIHIASAHTDAQRRPGQRDRRRADRAMALSIYISLSQGRRPTHRP